MIGRVLACGFACALAFGTVEPSLLEQGEAALERGELRPAAHAFGAHYRSLPADQRASAAGEYVVMYAAEVYDKAWAEQHDVADLDASRELLRAFVRDCEVMHGEAKPELTRAAKAKLADLDATVASLTPDEEAPPPAADDEAQAKSTAVEPPLTPAEPPHDRSGPDRVGVALLASGATLAVGGVAMLAAGLAGATERRAENKLDARCEADGMSGDACTTGKDSDFGRQYLADAKQTDRAVAIASIAPLVVGAALLIGGGVRLAQRRRADARIGVGSWAHRNGAGAFVRGRF